MNFTPRPYQHAMRQHILSHQRCALWASMGLGKTAVCLEALSALNALDSRPALVLAPLRVAAHTWPAEVGKWADFQHLRVQPITGSTKQRAAALKTTAPIYSTNYENLPWLVEHLGDDWPFATVIADEATRLKSFRLQQGSKRARALAKIAHTKIERFIELSGTPAPNGLQDLWGQLWFLDQGKRLGISFSAFKNRWFREVQVGKERFAFRLEPFAHSEKEIHTRLKDICLSLDAKDHFDIKAPIETRVEVPLPAEAKRVYKQLESELFADLQQGQISADNAAAKTLKCLQIASGAAYWEAGGSDFAEIHSAKLDALASIVSEAAGAPVLVAYHFKSDLVRLQKAFPQGRALSADSAVIEQWNNGQIPLLFAHPASCGHGLNLQDGGNILVFFSHWWNLEEYQQMLERLGPTRQAQAGHKRPVFIYHLIATGTLDETVIERRANKQTVQAALLNAAKRRGH